MPELTAFPVEAAILAVLVVPVALAVLALIIAVPAQVALACVRRDICHRHTKLVSGRAFVGLTATKQNQSHAVKALKEMKIF